MIPLVILALILAVLVGAGFLVKWLFIAAAIVALVWVILFFTSDIRRAT
jgi:hypothetical protein